MNPAIHLIDLGAPVDSGTLAQLMLSQGRSELVRGILQTIRDTALDAACSSVDGISARDDHFIHASLGRYDGLANVLNDFVKMTTAGPQTENQEDAMLMDNPVPTK